MSPAFQEIWRRFSSSETFTNKDDVPKEIKKKRGSVTTASSVAGDGGGSSVPEGGRSIMCLIWLAFSGPL